MRWRVHRVWISPIWFVAPVGFPLALAGGLALGRAQHHLAPAMPPGPMGSLALFALILTIFAPATALSFTHGPLFDVATATIPAGRGWATFGQVCLELFLTCALTGAALGGALGRSWAAAAAMGVAGLLLAAGPGHNIPFFGNHLPSALKGHALVVVVSASIAVSFQAALAWLRYQ